MRTTRDMHRDTLLNMKRQVKSDEPDVGGRELNIEGDQVEAKRTKDRLMTAIRLGPRSSKPEHSRTHSVSGSDRDQRSARRVAYGPKSAESASAHSKVAPNAYSAESSFSSVKVAAASPDIRRLRGLKADKSTVARYRGIIASDPAMVDVPLDQIPMTPYPPNDSEEVAREIEIIAETQDTSPLTDSVMDLAHEEPLELFKRACHALHVPVEDETVELLVHDLRRIAVTLKYVHLRPRPQALAPYHGSVVVLSQPDPYDDTPSYPSVHATIGYGLANMFAEMHPQHAEEFYNVGDTVALQRVQSGRHFPSDNEYAKVIADLILGR